MTFTESDRARTLIKTAWISTIEITFESWLLSMTYVQLILVLLYILSSHAKGGLRLVSKLESFMY